MSLTIKDGVYLNRANIEEVIIIAKPIVKAFEGLYLIPYLCPASVPTCGWGATAYENGQKVRLSDPAITKERAEQLLDWTLLNQCVPAVLALCPGETDPRRLAALVDFVFNLGAGALKASTLRKRINARDYAAARVEVMRWTRGGGKVLRGLVRRREAERAFI